MKFTASCSYCFFIIIYQLKFIFYNIEFNEKKLNFFWNRDSCDETAASIVQQKSNGSATILSNII